jgi:hypothetical protein
LLQVRIDRAGYHFRALRGSDFPDALSMVVDGSENSKYSLPYLCLIDKETSTGFKIKVLLPVTQLCPPSIQQLIAICYFVLQTKLYGAIVHGVFSAPYIYSDYQIGGSNVTIKVIHRFGSHRNECSMQYY